jgi:ATP-dependent helicase HepA
LLDPHRYTDRATFEREAESYAAVADFVDRLLDGGRLSSADRSSPLLAEPSGRLLARFDAAAAGTPGARQALIEELVDRHGPGRVVVRNTRATVGGFPARHVHLTPLPPAPSARNDASPDYSQDPRVPWLRDLLRDQTDEKLLLICQTRPQVEAINAALARLVNVPTAVFHEELTLVQRDRNAAYFADPVGARLLLCSEIGSEGRNFQFARHLVLFDLPEDPEVLEQRIGRLDRIGQTQAVEIHVPVPAGSSLEVRARWFHDGLGAFEQSVPGAHELYRRFGTAVEELARRFDRGDVDRDELGALLRATRAARDEVAARLASGRDRLLEQSSFRRRRAEALVEEIRGRDEDRELETFLLRLLEQHGVDVDEIAARTYRLTPLRVAGEPLPGLPADGLTATFARDLALAREDLAFLSWDHPLVATAVEMLSSETGNASFGMLDGGESPVLLLEACFVVECVSPPHLALDRFLPPTPLRITLDQTLEEPGKDVAMHLSAERLQRGSAEALLSRPEISATLLPRMLASLTERAEARLGTVRASATREMERALGQELERLELLRATGGRVREEEVDSARSEMAELREHLGAARLRLDALRLIWKGPRAPLARAPSRPED